MIRNLAKVSNVHIYNDSKDVFNINSTHITIHAVTAGIKEIKLPGKYHIFDPENGKRLFSNTSTLKIKMKQYESNIFGIEKCK